jgi:hypothetical protein
MGLDNYWKLPKESEHHPDFNPPLHLIGGVFSCYGKHSFRGKVYSDIIEKITGVSLYQSEIPNTMIKEMAGKLQAFTPTEGFFQDYHRWTGETFEQFSDEINDLKRMFSAYAEAGACLLGWW